MTSICVVRNRETSSPGITCPVTGSAPFTFTTSDAVALYVLGYTRLTTATSATQSISVTSISLRCALSINRNCRISMGLPLKPRLEKAFFDIHHIVLPNPVGQRGVNPDRESQCDAGGFSRRGN